jgi:hypothetical protein
MNTFLICTYFYIELICRYLCHTRNSDKADVSSIKCSFRNLECSYTDVSGYAKKNRPPELNETKQRLFFTK